MRAAALGNGYLLPAGPLREPPSAWHGSMPWCSMAGAWRGARSEALPAPFVMRLAGDWLLSAGGQRRCPWR